MTIYHTTFELLDDVLDIDAANEWFYDLNVKQELPTFLRSQIVSVQMKLTHEDKGEVFIETEYPLNDRDLDALSGWFSEKFDLGDLGDAFSQHWFAIITDHNEYGELVEGWVEFASLKNNWEFEEYD